MNAVGIHGGAVVTGLAVQQRRSSVEADGDGSVIGAVLLHPGDQGQIDPLQGSERTDCAVAGASLTGAAVCQQGHKLLPLQANSVGGLQGRKGQSGQAADQSGGITGSVIGIIRLVPDAQQKEVLPRRQEIHGVIVL